MNKQVCLYLTRAVSCAVKLTYELHWVAGVVYRATGVLHDAAVVASRVAGEEWLKAGGLDRDAAALAQGVDRR